LIAAVSAVIAFVVTAFIPATLIATRSRA
jgi:hypothetical protein